MPSRHRIDTSVTYDRNASLPLARAIEVPEKDPVPPKDPPRQQVAHEAYVASPQLEDAVNLSIALGRPLLMQGDPGCGKTRLAYAVAYALGLPLEECYIKSTSKAQDLLYLYDAVSRLYDSQVEPSPTLGKGARTRNRRADSMDVRRYIRFGPLGRAIIRATYGRRSVVLIDEIDKADLDFPNDLLRELDRLEFQVAESPDLRFGVSEARADLRPIVFVTHNEEKPLPTPFLRRCVFHYVEFPSDPDQLDRILGEHEITDGRLRSKAVEIVNRLRSLNLLKKPGLSELLDWAGYLQARGVTPEDVESVPAAEALIKGVADMKQAMEEFPQMRDARVGG